MKSFTSSLQPHVSPETHPKFLLGSNNYRSLEIPPICYIMASPEEPWSQQGSSWLEKEGKSISLSCRHFSFGFVYILLITLTIAYLISFTLPLQYFRAAKGRTSFSTPSASLLLFIKLACKRAGKYRRFLLFFFFLRAGVLQTQQFPFL